METVALVQHARGQPVLLAAGQRRGERTGRVPDDRQLALLGLSGELYVFIVRVPTAARANLCRSVGPGLVPLSLTTEVFLM